MRRLRLTPLRLAAAVLVGSFACTGVAYAASLGVVTNKLFAWSQTLTKANCNQTYTTEDDTYVDENNPTTNFGTAATINISGAAKLQYAFIRFDLSGCSLPTTGGADSATLTVLVTGHSNDTISVYPVYSSWTGSTLTWNGVSSLTIGTTATTTFVPSSNTSFSIPVTADVDAAIKAGTLWGWELKDTSGSSTTKIDSAQATNSAQRPTLTLADEK